MILFLSGIALLIIGYFTYGRVIVHLCNPDDRKTPAYTEGDGVDYVPLPQWKNMLIQLLNIAGIGPVIGVIIGIKFGTICFLIIPIGCIFAGAVHDCIAGFMSLRAKGANLPILMRQTLGKTYSRFFTLIIVLLLLLVVAVFINIPTNLITSFIDGDRTLAFWGVAMVVFVYYIAATLFPVDKIIGKIYPLFGAMLFIGSLAMLIMLVKHGLADPTLLTETEAFKAGMFRDQPIIPCLFVTIACGILSGFHATQSPIVARTMKDERQIRSTFYGMMIIEGIIAMIWAAAGLAIYNIYPELMSDVPTKALIASTTHFLGSTMGTVTIISVIILAITSGDTALRSLRLTIAEQFNISQHAFSSRIIILTPLMVIIIALLVWSNINTASFRHLWNYFAWGNQVMSASTLMMCTVWLMKNKHQMWYTLIPGCFMCFVVLSYILWTSPAHKGPYGFGLEINVAYWIAGIGTALIAYSVYRIGKKAAATVYNP